MPYTLHHVAPGDEALFARIAPEVFDWPVFPHRLRAYLADPAHHLLVALADGEIVGQCAAAVHRHPDKVDELYIDEVVVAPGWRRRGIARAMMEATLAWGRTRGCGEVWLGTEPDNAPALALYHSLRLPHRTAVIFEGEL